MLQELRINCVMLAEGVASFRQGCSPSRTAFRTMRIEISYLGFRDRTTCQSKQIDILNRQQEGTGKWVFENVEYKRWLDGTTKILWCRGIPEAGKTVLAFIIIDNMEQTVRQSDVDDAYIYCNYKEQDQSPISFIGSLLQHIVEQRGIVSEDIRSIYKHNSDCGRCFR